MEAARPVILFKKLAADAQIPAYSHEGDSGMDIRTVESWTLGPMGRHTFKTGVAAEIPKGYEIQVRPRSGLSSRGVVAMWGTVDQGYRGEIGVTLINLAEETVFIGVGDRIGQLVLAPVSHAGIKEADAIDEDTERGTNGFGSTGAK